MVCLFYYVYVGQVSPTQLPFTTLELDDLVAIILSTKVDVITCKNILVF